MQSVSSLGNDPVALQSGFDRFTLWGVYIRGVFFTLGFLCTVWALVVTPRDTVSGSRKHAHVLAAGIQPERIIAMASDPTINRAAITADLERARVEFHRLLAEATRHDAWTKPTRGTRWTNEQLLFHMVFGYMIVQRLVVLVKTFSQLPHQVSSVFARGLTAATGPFDAINYYGSCAAALFYNRRRMGAKMDRVITALQCSLAKESNQSLHRGMHFPTRWDPFFKDYMTLADVYRYPGEHFEFHAGQLTLNVTHD
jgi:hypothetical protein